MLSLKNTFQRFPPPPSSELMLGSLTNESLIDVVSWNKLISINVGGDDCGHELKQADSFNDRSPDGKESHAILDDHR